jgi:hypothetical protein
MSTVYEYKGVSYELPDGLTNEQAIARIKSSLGEAAPAPTTAAAAPAPEGRSMGQQLARQAGLTARAAYQGFTAPATAALDFLSSAYNLGAGALGSESRLPLASQRESQMLTQMGVPTPETGVERAVQAGTQALTSTAGLARVAPAAFGQDLARQLPAAGVGAAAAQPTAEAVKELTGSDLGAIVAGLLAGGVSGSAAGNLAGRLTTTKQPIMTMDEVRRRAERSYTAVTDAGIQLNQPAGQSLAAGLTKRLEDARYLPENAPPVRVALDKINQVVERGPVSFDQVSQLRQLANDLKNNQDRNVQRLAGVMVNEIDDFVARLSPKDVTAGAGKLDEAIKTLSSARKDWRNLSRANMLDDVLNVAEARAMDPKASESELIRRGFINLAADKNKMRLFNDAEQNAIKSVAKGGSLDSLLSLVARFNPERSQLIAGGVVGGGVVSPESLMVSAPIMAAGYGADKLLSAQRQGAAQRAVAGLLSGSTPAPRPSTYGTGLLGGALVLSPEEISRAAEVY